MGERPPAKLAKDTIDVVTGLPRKVPHRFKVSR